MVDVNNPGGPAPTEGEPSPQADSQQQFTSFDQSATSNPQRLDLDSDGRPNENHPRFKEINQNWRDEQGRSAQLQQENDQLRAQLTQQPKSGGIDDYLQQQQQNGAGLVHPGLGVADVQRIVDVQVNAHVNQFRQEQAQADSQRQQKYWLDRVRADIPFSPEVQQVSQRIYEEMPGLQNIPEGQYVATKLAVEQLANVQAQEQEPQMAAEQHRFRRESQLESPSNVPPRSTAAKREAGMSELAQISYTDPNRDEKFTKFLQNSGLIQRRVD